MRVDFYHLTRVPLERVLPQLAARVVGEGGRLLIVAADDALAEAIDRQLWLPPESFLPHARLGTGDDAAQPVLIAPDVNAANGARTIALADGAWRDEALDFDRALFLFDECAVAAARIAWRALGAREGLERHYWSYNAAGRWEDQGLGRAVASRGSGD